MLTYAVRLTLIFTQNASRRDGGICKSSGYALKNKIRETRFVEHIQQVLIFPTFS